MDELFNPAWLVEIKNRVVNNSIASFEGMTAQRWVRIVAIIGAYMLIRPYLLGAAAKRQKKQLDKEAEELGLGERSGPNANSLRGGKKAGPGKVLGEVKDGDRESGEGVTKRR
jgi:hypothetical protein